MMAEDLIFFSVPVAAFEARGRVEDCGLLYFVMIGFRLASYPLGGFLSDGLGTRRVFFVSHFFRAVVCMGACACLYLNHSAILLWLLSAVTFSEGDIKWSVQRSFRCIFAQIFSAPSQDPNG